MPRCFLRLPLAKAICGWIRYVSQDLHAIRRAIDQMLYLVRNVCWSEEGSWAMKASKFGINAL